MSLTPKTEEDDDAIEILLLKKTDQLTTWEIEFLESLVVRKRTVSSYFTG